MRSFLALLVAVNPVVVAVAVWPRERRLEMAVAVTIAFAGAVVTGAVSEPILDALDVTPGTFRVAAAVVLGLVGAQWLLAGGPSVAAGVPNEGWARVAVPLLFPVIFTPQLFIVSVSTGVDDGVVMVAAGTAVGLALALAAAVATKRHQPVWNAGARFAGALAIVVALALAVDGVKTV